MCCKNDTISSQEMQGCILTTDAVILTIPITKLGPLFDLTYWRVIEKLKGKRSKKRKRNKAGVLQSFGKVTMHRGPSRRDPRFETRIALFVKHGNQVLFKAEFFVDRTEYPWNSRSLALIRLTCPGKHYRGYTDFLKAIEQALDDLGIFSLLESVELQTLYEQDAEAMWWESRLVPRWHYAPERLYHCTPQGKTFQGLPSNPNVHATIYVNNRQQDRQLKIYTGPNGRKHEITLRQEALKKVGIRHIKDLLPRMRELWVRNIAYREFHPDKIAKAVRDLPGAQPFDQSPRAITGQKMQEEIAGPVFAAKAYICEIGEISLWAKLSTHAGYPTLRTFPSTQGTANALNYHHPSPPQGRGHASRQG